MTDKKFETDRKAAIAELNKLEKQFGSEVFRGACNRKLTIDRQMRQRQHQIIQAEKELQQLKTGKTIPPY